MSPSSAQFFRPLIPRACYAGHRVGSLRSRRNLTSVVFEFSFTLIGKSTMAFITNQSWRVIKSWYTGGDPEQEFRAVSQTDLSEFGTSVVLANRVSRRRRQGRFDKHQTYLE